MALSIDEATLTITVPKADMVQVQTDPFEIRELDLDDFQRWLRDWEDSEAGMVMPVTHNSVSPITVGSITLAKVVELINGYTVTFEDGQYAVNIVGGNSNVGDKVNLNQVSVRSANSAGLIQTAGADPATVAAAVWDRATASHTSGGTFGAFIQSKLLTVGKFLGLK